MFKLKDASSDHAAHCKSLLDALPPQIEEIRSYEVGVDVLRSERSWDLVLVSTFDDIDALERYRVHPAHEEVARYLVDAWRRAPPSTTRPDRAVRKRGARGRLRRR